MGEKCMVRIADGEREGTPCPRTVYTPYHLRNFFNLDIKYMKKLFDINFVTKILVSREAIKQILCLKRKAWTVVVIVNLVSWVCGNATGIQLSGLYGFVEMV